MKTVYSSVSVAFLVSAALPLLGSSARAAVPVPYHAGRYTGSMQIITTDSTDPFLRTVATLKLRAHSDGSTTLRLLATPQTAMPVLPTTDDYLIKVFALQPGPGVAEPAVYLAENPAMDTDGSGGFTRGLDSQTVTGSTITARVSYQRTFAGGTYDVQVIIRLRRIAP